MRDRSLRLLSPILKNTFCHTLPVPVFLCPSLLWTERGQGSRHISGGKELHKQWQRRIHTEATTREVEHTASPQHEIPGLPFLCPGCGALRQTAIPDEAGFYTPSRRSVRQWLRQEQEPAEGSKAQFEAETYSKALENADQKVLEQLGVGDGSSQKVPAESPATTPVCDRCNHLLHHHRGNSIAHPSIESLHDTIAESPHKYNHIYHVLDAADFPLSLVQNIHRKMSVTPQRSQNRRSKTERYFAGKKAELTFIITRSDLLAPKKEQVDTLMPYLVEVLRDALGADGRDVRIGNVRCVSSKRGWWTKEVKEDIWRRGGGGWMVGKVNVGKSNLFECVFPKGRHEAVSYNKLQREASIKQREQLLREIAADESTEAQMLRAEQHVTVPEHDTQGGDLNVGSLLPPLQQEVAYPTMPIISSMPGTTASPIRLSFGGGRGELVDLPGLSRGNLEGYVQQAHQQELVMRTRVTPVQAVIKPGQSLVAGGLIRITPTTPNTVVLAFSFLPFDSHVTSTEKAIGMHTQQRESGVSTIASNGIGGDMASAGTFQLKWDVTKQRSGPVTRPSAVGIKTDRLPYRIFSTDILVEGSGWIELVTQVRKRDIEHYSSASNDSQDPRSSQPPGGLLNDAFPEVEIFSPKGEHVGARRPMNGWLLGGPKETISATKRPRRSKKGEKKTLKRGK